MHFSRLLKDFMTLYQVTPEYFAKELDRHPSRIRHWMNDSLPGKKVFKALLEVIVAIGDANSVDDLRLFIENHGTEEMIKQLEIVDVDNKEVLMDCLPNIFIYAYQNNHLMDYTKLIEALNIDFSYGKYDEVNDRITELLKSSENHISNDQLYELYVFQARCYFTFLMSKRDLSYSNKAIDLLNEAIKLYQRPTVAIKFQIERLKGVVYAIRSNLDDTKENLEKAKEYFEKAISLYDETCFLEDYLRLLNNLVGVHFSLCKIENPTSNLEKASRYLERVHEKLSDDLPMDLRIISYNNLLAVYSTYVAVDKSDEYYIKCMKVYEEAVTKSDLTIKSDFLGFLFSVAADTSLYYGNLIDDHILLNKSLLYYQKAEESFSTENQRLHRVIAHMNQVNVNVNFMDRTNSERVYQETMEIVDYCSQEFNEMGIESWPALEKYKLGVDISYLLLSNCNDKGDIEKRTREALDRLLQEENSQLDLLDYLVHDVKLSFYEHTKRGDSLLPVYFKCKDLVSHIDVNEYRNMMCQAYVMLFYMCQFMSQENSDKWHLESEIHAESARVLVSEKVYMGMIGYFGKLFV